MSLLAQSCVVLSNLKQYRLNADVMTAAIHIIMLNAYDSYLPNNTLDATSNGVSQVLFGNSGGPSFQNGNYPQV